MARVEKMPITVPQGVEISSTNGRVTVKGAKTSLSLDLPKTVQIELKDGVVRIAVVQGEASPAIGGTVRALVNNMVQGVTKGFEKKLNLVGVGYRAQVQGDKLNLTLGFSHPVVHQMPKGVKCETPAQTEILIKGIDKQQVGQVAAEVRAYRKPEPYKGKGVRYVDEVIVLKETKKK